MYCLVCEHQKEDHRLQLQLWWYCGLWMTFLHVEIDLEDNLDPTKLQNATQFQTPRV